MRSILLYLALVGVPLLGVLGILQIGRGLVPPPAFGGTWRIEPETAESGAGCALPAGTMRIEQSGLRARVMLGAGAGSAEVDGRALRTRTLLPTSGGDCSGWHLDAAGLGGAVPERLEGRLVPEGCACAPVAFTARRTPEQSASAAH